MTGPAPRPIALEPNEIVKFWAKVKRRDGHRDCHLWDGYVFSSGYGGFSTRTGFRLAHRVAWTLAHQDPGAAQIRHTCHTKRCVNPEHMTLAL